MLAWWITFAFANPCADLIDLPPDLGRPPDAWPTYRGRCLDQGPSSETLLRRARRCVREEPEDPSPIELLGHLGGAADVPVLEALTLHMIHEDVALEALHRLGEVARPAMVRLACHHHEKGGRAVAYLQLDPRPEEWTLYNSTGLGRLGLPHTLRALMSSITRGHASRGIAAGLAADPTPQGLAALLAYRSTPERHAHVVHAIPIEHRAIDRVLADAAASEAVAPRLAIVRRLRDLPDAKAEPLLRAALTDTDGSVREAAVRWLAETPERFPQLVDVAANHDDMALAFVFHRVRAAVGDGHSLAVLRELADDPVHRWSAIEALLRAERHIDTIEVDAWMDFVSASEDAPRDLTSWVERRRRRDAPEPPPAVDLSDHPVPSFSRARTPPRDAARMRRRARAALDNDDRTDDAFGLAVLPWVGDDTDVDRLTRKYHDPPAPLANLATPRALDRLAEAHGNHWTWTRTPRGWRELVAAPPRIFWPRGVVRPDMLPLAQALAEARGHVPVDTTSWSIREQREALHRAFRPSRGLPTAEGLDQLDEGAMQTLTHHHGHRWIVMAHLDELDDATRARALRGLVDAPWREPPPPVVQQAAQHSTSQGAWRLRLAAGDDEAALAAMRGGDLQATKAVLAAIAEPEPATHLVEAVTDWVHHGGFPDPHAGELLRAPLHRSILKQAVLAGLRPKDDPCRALGWVGADGLDMPDEWLVERIRACPKTSTRLSRERAVSVQKHLLATDLTGHQLVAALSLHRGDIDLLRPYLDDARRPVQQEVWRALGGPSLPADLLPWVRAHVDGPYRELALSALWKHDPDAVVVFAALVADHDDAWVAGALHQMATDASIAALVPILQRGTSPDVEQIAGWVRAHGGPPYEAHRELVDDLLRPTWRTEP